MSAFLGFGRRRKPDHFDLAMEAMGSALCEAEHVMVQYRFVMLATIDTIAELQQDLDREKRLHKIDSDLLRRLFDADVETDVDCNGETGSGADDHG